jgi:hypothetical protein
VSGGHGRPMFGYCSTEHTTATETVTVLVMGAISSQAAVPTGRQRDCAVASSRGSEERVTAAAVFLGTVASVGGFMFGYVRHDERLTATWSLEFPLTRTTVVRSPASLTCRTMPHPSEHITQLPVNGKAKATITTMVLRRTTPTMGVVFRGFRYSDTHRRGRHRRGSQCRFHVG